MKSFVLALSILVSACGDDTSTLDASPSPDSSAALQAAQRRRAAEEGGATIECACQVEEGMATNIEACVASSDGISTAEEVTCMQALLDGTPQSNTSVFNCRTQFLETFNTCLGQLSCANVLGETGPDVEACFAALNMRAETCGVTSVAAEIDACLN